MVTFWTYAGESGTTLMKASILFSRNQNYIKQPYIYQKSIEPVHEISNNLACATSKASDQPAHTRSLIRAFASRLSIL